MSGPSARYAGGATGPVKFSAAEYADASYVDQFKFKVREWWSIVQRVRSEKAPTAELETSRQRLLAMADTVKEAVKKVTAFSDTLAVPGLNGLGALPLIPIAIVGAALSAIAYWSSQYVAYRKKLAEYRYQADLVGQGVSPQDAARIAKEQAEAGEEPTGPLALILKHWQLVALGIGGMILYKVLKK